MNESLEPMSTRNEGGRVSLLPRGAWRLSEIASIASHLASRRRDASARADLIDGSELKELDTAGALYILRAAAPDLKNLEKIELKNFQKRHTDLLQLVMERYATVEAKSPPPFASLSHRLGQFVMTAVLEFVSLVSFIGRLFYSLAEAFLKPSLFRIKELVIQLEQVCLKALPVVCLVTFLIGIVIAYLYSMQAEKYGANIFIVDGIGFAMCRELSPIITAIILAGRSGSAFTAQLGTMKLNEEVDAMKTLGLSPMHVLVFPRVLALMIAMPLLVFVGDVIGIVGGILVADLFLGITPRTFLERLQVVLKLRHVFVGLIKAPVFAFFISVIGCRMGLNVENNARSVGLHTTSTVVQGIVSVIILNAIFAVVFAELRL